MTIEVLRADEITREVEGGSSVSRAAGHSPIDDSERYRDIVAARVLSLDDVEVTFTDEPVAPTGITVEWAFAE